MPSSLPAILKRIEHRLVHAIWRWQQPPTEPHLHILVPEALWRVDDASPICPPAPSDDDVVCILKCTLRLTAKDLVDMKTAFPETVYEETQNRHSQERLNLQLEPTIRKRRTASFNGFSLHADTAVHSNDRDGLKRLCRYGAGGPLSDCRLSRLEDGRYQYVPKGKHGVLLSLNDVLIDALRQWMGRRSRRVPRPTGVRLSLGDERTTAVEEHDADASQPSSTEAPGAPCSRFGTFVARADCPYSDDGEVMCLQCREHLDASIGDVNGRHFAISAQRLRMKRHLQFREVFACAAIAARCRVRVLSSLICA